MRFFDDFFEHQHMIRRNRENQGINNLFNLLLMIHSRSNPNRGMDQADLSKIQEINFKLDKNIPEEESEKCVVCYDEFLDNEKIKILPCKHLFHGGCIDTWLVQNKKCPVCKADVNV